MYAKRRYICGRYIEEERYNVLNNYISSKSRPRIPKDKTKLTTEQREEQNYKNAEKKARRLANTNFIHGKDLFVTLTGKTFKTLEEMQRMTKNYIARLQYHFDKNNLGEFKYIYSYGEHKEKKKAKKTGVHTHLIISGISIDTLIAIWEKDKNAGRIHVSKLEFDNKRGIGGLIAYFIKNTKELKQRYKERGEYKKVKNMRSYNPSLNLEKPKGGKVEFITGKKMREEPKARKGYMITDVENIPTSYGMYQIIHMIKIDNMRN